MEEGLRFVLIGSGNISNTYVAAAHNVPGVRIVSIVSRSGNRPRAWPPGQSVEVTPALRSVRVPFDAVIVATPNGMHCEYAVEAATLGKHVLTEKPLDVTRPRCDAIIAACHTHGVRLGVTYQRRMSPDNRALKELLDFGRLGRVIAADVQVKFFRDEAYYRSAPYRGTWAGDGGGPFMHQASHQLDLYTWFFGLPQKVLAACGTFLHRIEVEDHGAAIFQHPNGMIGTFVASTCCRPGFSARMEIHTERGSVILENDRITQWRVEGIENPSRAPTASIHDGATSAAVTDTAGHEAILADFVAAVREGREPAISGASARMATELALRVYEASARVLPSQPLIV